MKRKILTGAVTAALSAAAALPLLSGPVRYPVLRTSCLLAAAARREAIAAMPERFAADIRTSAQRALDEKREKRRLREARRLANFRRSRRGA